MLAKFKYDFAISVAEEDRVIAEHIAVALQKKGIRYYLYSEHLADHLGKPILKVTLDAYKTGARYVLMITSKKFVQKYWAGIENQVAQIFANGREDYVIQIRLDATPVDGLSKHTVFLNWNNNPDEIAELLYKKLQKKDPTGKKTQPVRAKQAIIVFFLAAVSFFVIYINVNVKPAGSGALTDNIAKDASLKRPDTGNLIDNKDKPGSPSNSGQTREKGQDAQPSSKRDRSVNKPSVVHTIPANGESSAKKNYDYCIVVTGNDTDLNNMLTVGITNLLRQRKSTITTDAGSAGKIIRLYAQESTTTSAEYAGVFSSSCNYQFSITRQDDAVLQSFNGRTVTPGFSKSSNLNALSAEILKKINPML